LFPARPLAAPLTAYGGHKAALLYVTALDRDFTAAFQAGVRPLAQLLIEKEADMRGRNLVRGDIVAQLGIVLRVLCVPGQVFSGQLPPDQFWIFSQKKDTSLKFAGIRALLDAAGK